MSDSSGRSGAEHRAVLVASGNELFLDLVSEMLLETGFSPTIWHTDEAPWLAIVRVQPCLIVCDCEAPGTDAQRLVVDATARGIPLLLSQTASGMRVEPAVTKRQRVEWFTFPITTNAFRAVVEALVAPTVALSSEGQRSFLPG